MELRCKPNNEEWGRGQALDERAWIEVNLAHLAENAATLRAAAPRSELLPVVKADAYGLGAVPVAHALVPLKPWGFAVATASEGMALRESGIREPILVLMPARPDMLEEYRQWSLRAVLDDAAALSHWNLPFHLEIDTGMGRTGVRWDEVELLSRLRNPHLEAAFTQFHSADRDVESLHVQWSRFQQALELLPRRPRLLHASNSAACFRHSSALNLIRPGIYLFGGRPAADLPRPKAVISVRARVISLRRLRAGETLSYGADWTTSRDTSIATLGVGYADGVLRAIQSRGQMLLGGRRVPIVGRVTMDMTMVDLGPEVPHGVQIGDVATVVGRDRDQEITWEEYAEWGGTISYEMMTRLSPRLPRCYLTNDAQARGTSGSASPGDSSTRGSRCSRYLVLER